MPLGIVSSEDYEKDLGNVSSNQKDIPKQEDLSKDSDEGINPESNSIESSRPNIEVLPAIGRGKGNTEVPQAIRKIIGESAIEEGSSAASAIGKFLGISSSSISAYSNGATSTSSYKEGNKDLQSFLTKSRNKIIKRAQGKLYKSLEVIDDEKLDKLTALEASTVARNMSAIVKNLEPDDKRSNTFNGPVITFYAPSIVTEDRFESININE